MTRENATDEALEWTIRVQHPEFAAWDELTAWLAADPRNAEDFHRLTLLDDEVVAAIGDAPAQPAQPVQSVAPILSAQTARPRAASRGGWRRWGRVAAGVALVAGLGSLALGLIKRAPPGVSPGASPGASSTIVAITTRPGERRDLRLADGTQVALAGASRLSIDATGRHAELEEGQAMFSVVHDPARPFSVRLGAATVTDVGTIFDLRRREGRNAVAVAQGEVRVEGAGAPVEVVAGRRLRFGGGAAVELDAIAPNAVAGWRGGRFSYADAPVTEVVADIEQTTGAQIRMSPEVANRRFAGAIAVSSGDAGQTLRSVAPVMGLSVAREGQVWVLSSAHDSLQRQ